MMMDAVIFDLGSARPPLFALPDASGLAPLTLPDAFLRGQSHQPQAELPPDTVRRFETAMSAEPKLPPSVVECLMAHMSPGTPKVEGQKVESPKVKCPTIEDSEVESPKVKSPAVEGLKAESRKTEISSLVSPVPVASVEEPVVLVADAVIHADPVARPVEEELVVTSPGQPKIQVVAAPGKQTVGVEPVPAKPAERPMRAMVDNPTVATMASPVVASVDKPEASIVGRPPVATVEVPMVAAVEKLVTAVPVERPAVVTAAAGVHESSVARLVDEKAIIAAPVSFDKLVASAVEFPKVVTVERPETSAVESPKVVTVERPEVSAVESPKIVTVERPEVSAVEAPKSAIVERPVVVTTGNPTTVTIEKPVVAVGDKKVISAPDRPTGATVEVPTVGTVEKPVAADPLAVPTIAPAILENPVNRVEVEGRPVAASNTPILPDAPATRSDVMVEAPVAVDKPMVMSQSWGFDYGNADSPSKIEGVAVGRGSMTGDGIIPPRPFGALPLSQGENLRIHPQHSDIAKPFVAPSDNAKIQVIVTNPEEPDVISAKTPVVIAERPVAAKVSHPAVATVDKPEEKAVAAAAHVVVAPAAVEASAPQVLQAAPEVAAASAASARTEAIVETVNQIVEVVVGQILVTPGITHGEGEIKIMLKPTVLDGSEIAMSAKDGTLTVSITPATQEASAAAAAALPRLEIALAEHAPAFHHVSVALQLKKGTRNEAV